MVSGKAKIRAFRLQLISRRTFNFDRVQGQQLNWCIWGLGMVSDVDPAASLKRKEAIRVCHLIYVSAMSVANCDARAYISQGSVEHPCRTEGIMAGKY